MNTPLLLTAFGVMAAPIFSQHTQGEAQPILKADSFRPARSGDEGEKRFESRLPENLEDYVAVPMPQVSGQHTGPIEAVSFNLITGEETYHTVPSDLSNSGWISGRELSDMVNENLIRSFGSLTAVTSTSYPWSTQSRMFFNQGSGSFLCSGTMIDAKTMITAGHCVHEGPGGTWSTNISIAPAWDGDSDAFGTANGIYMATWSSWVNSGDWGGDMGYVRLDRPVGFLTGWLGYGYNDSDSWWSSTTFNLAGYPGGCFTGAPNQLYYNFGTWDTVNTSVVEANMSESCWVGGMSGAGLYYIDSNGSCYVFADQSHAWGPGTSRIGSCRMEGYKFDYMLNTFIPGAYSTVQEDFVPLRVDIGAENPTVRAGEAVPDLDYLVYNSSAFDPASTNVDVEVYLSTNDNISEFDTLIQSHYFTWDFAPKSGVTVNGWGPTIPVDTVPGTYFVGVIIDEVDADTNNNDTDGWDAAQVTVIEPLDSITLRGPAFANVGETVTYDVEDAPTSAAAFAYYSLSNTGSTINGHPFELGYPYTLISTGTTSSAGTWSISGVVPPALFNVKIWIEVRVDKYGYTYDSNTKTLRGT